ncbi:MAG: methyltransferase domain-containing protein [Gammaproteobacteria bacterium]
MRYHFCTMNMQLPLSARARSLSDWYLRPLGRQLADAETSALAAQVTNLFGYHMVVVDPPWEDCRLDDSRIAHRVVQRVANETLVQAGLMADTENWPIMTDSVDAVVLPHTLELAHDPHQVLREADRCLVPDGHIVIIGFNPRSLWGIRRVLARRRGGMPWDTRFQGMGRVKDWLALLGFDTLHSHFLFQRPPLQSERILGRLRFMEPANGIGLMLLSAAYILVARKRTVILTPLRATQRAKPRLFPVGIPSSSQGNVRRSN